jgi:hypothetical protein
VSCPSRSFRNGGPTCAYRRRPAAARP